MDIAETALFIDMPPWIYLASQSPRRSQLLQQLDIAHELLLPGSDEDAEALEAVLPGEAPVDYVQRVTGLKLGAAVQRHARRGLPPAAILCADTTVALGDAILGKPQDSDDAARMLAELSGQMHQVFTAVALAWADRRWAALSVSQVQFAQLTPEQIAAYVASGEPMGKAGAYGIQGRAAAFIAHIEGSYTGIMGLPLFETAQLLRSAGV